MMLMLFRTWLGSCEHMNLEETEQSWGQELDLEEVSNGGAPWVLYSPMSVKEDVEETEAKDAEMGCETSEGLGETDGSVPGTTE